MWKNRSNAPPRPDAGSSKRVDAPYAPKIMPPHARGGGAGSRASTSPFRGAAATPSSSAAVSIRNRSASPPPSRASAAYSRGRPGTPTGPAARSMSPQQEAYYSSLSRPRSPHFQLRDEISSLRCRIQRTELQLKARQAMDAKNKRLQGLFDGAKQTRAMHNSIRTMRQNQANARTQSLWERTQRQHAATRTTMQQLFKDRQESMRAERESKSAFYGELKAVGARNGQLLHKTVQEMRDSRRLSRMEAAAAQARRNQQCRDEFERDVGLVTRLTKQRNDTRLDAMRNRLHKERAGSAERRARARDSWHQQNVHAREEVEGALTRAKTTEAKMLLEERRRLLAFERRLLSSQ